MGCLCARSRNHNYPYYNSARYSDDEKVNIDAMKKFQEANLNETLQFRLKPQKTKFISSSLTEQKVQILASIKAVNAQKVDAVDVVAVIDISRSMKGAKIETAKKCVQALLNNLGVDDRLSLVFFDNDATRATPLKRMNNSNKQKVVSLLGKIECKKITNIYHGLLRASQIIHSRRYVSSKPCVMLFSDGANQNAVAGCNFLQQNHYGTNDYSLFTFAMGEMSDSFVLESLAKNRKGKFFAIEDDSARADGCIKEAFGSLTSQLTGHGTLTIKADDSVGRVELVECINSPEAGFTCSKQGLNWVIQIPHVGSADAREILITAKIPQIPSVDKEARVNRIASGLLNIADLGGEEYVLKADAKLEFYNEDEEIADLKDDEDVTLAYFRVNFNNKIKDVMTRAGTLNDRKKMVSDYIEEITASSVSEHPDAKKLAQQAEENLVKLDGGNPSIIPKVGKQRRNQQQQQNLL